MTKLNGAFRCRLPRIGIVAFATDERSFKRIKKWLTLYLSGKPCKFPYQLDLKGTKFQIAVWRTLMKIPFGETRTYRWVAERIGRPNAARAVGNACGANPIPIVIPCHRVVASNGLGGFSSGLHIKKNLLNLESQNKW